ncbi:MAG: tyrosine-type recombinase/integrase [Actinomycetota bacterium]|nr:tyrosine-type recombinase/integrase [Actinomycetota bacterium]
MATIKKRGDKYYVVYYFEGKHRWKVAGPREIDAKRLKSKTEKSIHEGTFREIENKTFKELAGEWLKIKKKEIRPNTYVAYKSCVKKLEKHIGDKKIKAIGPKEVDQLAGKLSDEDISASTVSRSLSILFSIFKKAVQWGYIPSNPAEYVKKPQVNKPEVEYLEPEEVKRLLKAAGELDEIWGKKDHKRDYMTCRKALLMFACLTGARQSEILGLRWGDLDLEERRAYIRQVLQGGKFYPPKSQAGRRVIDLPPVLVEELKTHRLRQAVELEQNPGDLVFTTSEGTPMDRRNATQRILEPSLTRAELRKVGFHALRHSYVSMLIAQGESVKTVQTLAGHSTARMTVDVYGHMLQDAGKAAAARLQNTLFGELVEFDANEFANES